MTEEIKIKIPDIGGATDVDVIDILVKAGDQIKVDTPLITLESDKASMDIPSPQAGKVAKIEVKVGDMVSEGDLILTLVGEEQASTVEQKTEPTAAPRAEEKPVESAAGLASLFG